MWFSVEFVPDYRRNKLDVKNYAIVTIEKDNYRHLRRTC